MNPISMDCAKHLQSLLVVRLLLPFGLYGHPDLPDSRFKLCTLEGVLHDAVLEVFKVIHETLVPLLQYLGTPGELRGEVNRPNH